MDLAAFSRTHIYSTHALPHVIERDVHELQGLDRYYERKVWQWTRRALVGFLMAFPVMCVASGENTSEKNLMLVGFVLCIAWVINAFRLRAKYEQRDLEDRRYQLIARLVRCLAMDMRPDQPLRVMLDLRKPDVAPKHTHKGTTNGWAVEYFRDPWLQLQGRFADGTRFAIRITDIVQNRSRPKIGQSGKRKIKTKQKGKAIAVVELAAKPEAYPLLPQVAEGVREAVQLPGQARLKDLKIRGHRLALECIIPYDWHEAEESEDRLVGSRVVAMMLLSLYQVLNLARSLEKRMEAA